ncbi:hypothetical protein ACM26V_11540 [Salipaludibacillus sp. HK11]|uniref:hypothetical protein n=1 Tax=Salipaludibacillus sp. HK11 TaxID=3394320 RepID=UPI0039FD89EA
MENEKRSETARNSERSSNKDGKTLQISEGFGAFEEWRMKNDPKQRGIRSVRGMKNEKRSETARNSERSSNKDRKTLQISEEFGTFEEWRMKNDPKQRGIRSVRVIKIGKRSKSVRNSERLRNGE